MALTPDEVVNKQFQVTRFRDGYDQDEVDDFLDEIVVEFRRLGQENDQLKGQLASGQIPQAEATAQATGEELAQWQARVADLEQQLESAKQAPPQASAEGAGALDGMNSAEYLQLARRVHEEHVKEGVAKRDQLIAEGETNAKAAVEAAQANAASVASEAQSKADALVAEAQSKADALLGDAQSKAEVLVAEAQSKHETQVASLQTQVSELEATKATLQKSVDELQEFEHSYRATLQSFIEGQLSELASAAPEGLATSTSSQAATPSASASFVSQPIPTSDAEPTVESFPIEVPVAPSEPAAVAEAPVFDAVPAYDSPVSAFEASVPAFEASAPAFDAPAAVFDAATPVEVPAELPAEVAPAIPAFEPTPVFDAPAAPVPAFEPAPEPVPAIPEGWQVPEAPTEEFDVSEISIEPAPAEPDDDEGDATVVVTPGMTYEVPRVAIDEPAQPEGFGPAGGDQPPAPPFPGFGGN